jgi:uncharacterized membrane protein
MRYPALQLLLMALCFSASANMTGSVDASGSAHLLLGVSLPDAAGRELVLNLTGPSAVVVRDRSGLVLPATVEDSGNYTIVRAAVPVDYLEYDITSDAFTAKSGDSWSFDFVMGASENLSSFGSSIQFPPGAVIRSTNGAVQQDEGTLSIHWTGSGLDPSKRIHLKSGYEVPPESVQQDPIVFMLVLAAFLVLAYLMVRFRPKREPLSAKPLLESIRAAPPLIEENSVFKTLDETDKEILREISAQNGKTTQAHLYTHTHVPKATLSRRLASLENRGIIRKSHKGNRNLVTLTDIVMK